MSQRPVAGRSIDSSRLWKWTCSGLTCPSSTQVLIIGGGDGGVLRELVKHPSVESVVQCEIDEVGVVVQAWVPSPRSALILHPKAQSVFLFPQAERMIQ